MLPLPHSPLSKFHFSMSASNSSSVTEQPLVFRAFSLYLGANGGTRTRTPFGTSLSDWRVYQFHHVRKLTTGAPEEIRTPKNPRSKRGDCTRFVLSQGQNPWCPQRDSNSQILRAERSDFANLSMRAETKRPPPVSWGGRDLYNSKTKSLMELHDANLPSR